MKENKKAVVYDLEYMNEPLHTTLGRKPKGVTQTRFHRAFFFAWFAAGTLLLGMAVLEIFTDTMYNTIIRAATGQMADYFGLDADTMSAMASDALLKGKSILILFELALSALFFLCAYYSQRLVARNDYIAQLEKAALDETAVLMKEEEREYEAAE